MNSLILIHNKYHSNENRDDNNEINDLMDIEIKDEKINNINPNEDKYYFDPGKKKNIDHGDNNISSNFNRQLNNSFNCCFGNDLKINDDNNLFNINYNIKSNNFFNNSKNNFNNGFFQHTFKKPSKRNYLNMISKDIYTNENEDNNNNKSHTIINLNINNNNYYYINNNKYISSEEKYGIDFSKKKTLKKY